LNKIIILIFFLINTLWANIGTNEDLKVLKELGLESSFLSDFEVINITMIIHQKIKLIIIEMF
jgi:hypothetical protein